jgi:hypothetical protein
VYERSYAYPEYLIEWLPDCPIIKEIKLLPYPAPEDDNTLKGYDMKLTLDDEDREPEPAEPPLRPLWHRDTGELAGQMLVDPRFRETEALQTMLTQLRDQPVQAYWPHLLAVASGAEVGLLQLRWELADEAKYPKLLPGSWPLLTPQIATSTNCSRGIRSLWRTGWAPSTATASTGATSLPQSSTVTRAAIGEAGLTLSFVDYREYELFQFIFGLSYTTAIEAFGLKQWFRMFEPNDDWLLGQPKGSFLIRLNSQTRTALTLALVTADSCASTAARTTDLKKAKILSEGSSSVFLIPNLITEACLPDLLRKIEGVEYARSSELEYPMWHFIRPLLRNFHTRVLCLLALERLADSVSSLTDCQTFFPALNQLERYLSTVPPPSPSLPSPP